MRRRRDYEKWTFLRQPALGTTAKHLASEVVARALKGSLQKITEKSDGTVKWDFTDSDLYRAQRQELHLEKTDVSRTLYIRMVVPSLILHSSLFGPCK